MEITFSKIQTPEEGTLILGVDESLELSPILVDLDKKTGGAITESLKGSAFKAKKGKCISILATVGLSLERVVLLGAGGSLWRLVGPPPSVLWRLLGAPGITLGASGRAQGSLWELVGALGGEKSGC